MYVIGSCDIPIFHWAQIWLRVAFGGRHMEIVQFPHDEGATAISISP